MTEFRLALFTILAIYGGFAIVLAVALCGGRP